MEEINTQPIASEETVVETQTPTEDNVSSFFNDVVKPGGYFATENDFRSFISDENNSKDFFEDVVSPKGYFGTFEEFSSFLGEPPLGKEMPRQQGATQARPQEVQRLIQAPSQQEGKPLPIGSSDTQLVLQGLKTASSLYTQKVPNTITLPQARYVVSSNGFSTDDISNEQLNEIIQNKASYKSLGHMVDAVKGVVSTNRQERVAKPSNVQQVIEREKAIAKGPQVLAPTQEEKDPFGMQTVIEKISSAGPTESSILVNYDTYQQNAVNAEKNMMAWKTESEMPINAKTGEPKTPQQRSQEKAAYQSSLKAYQENKRLANQSLNPAKNVMSALAQDLTKENDWKNFVNKEGFADAFKINKVAKEIALKNGFSADGPALKYLESQIQAKVNYKKTEPEIQARFAPKELEILNQAKVDSEKAQEDFAKVSKTIAESKFQIDNIRKEIEALVAQDADPIKLAYDSDVIELDNLLQQAYDVTNQALEANKLMFESGAISQQEAIQKENELIANYEAGVTQNQADKLQLFNSVTDKLNVVNSKYQARFKRQQEEIVRASESAYTNEFNDFVKKYNLDEATTKKLQDAYRISVNETLEVEKQKRLDYEKSIGEGFFKVPEFTKFAKAVFSADGGVLDVTDLAYLIPVNTEVLGISLTNSIGTALESLGNGFGIEPMRVLGKDMANNSDVLAPKEDVSWSSLADWTSLQKSIGNLAGSMLPSMVATAGATALTGGFGLPATMTAGALAGWATESMQMANQVYLDTLKETGDAVKAEQRANNMWDFQKSILFAYGAESLPFVSVFAKGTKTIGRKALVGGATELFTESVIQEFPQTIAEEAIMKDANALKAVGEAYQGVGAYLAKKITGEDINAAEQAAFKKFKTVTIETAPVFLLGAGGQVMSSFREQGVINDAEDVGRGFVQDIRYGRLNDTKTQQFLMRLVTAKGVDFANTMITGLYTAGEIDAKQKDSFANTIAKSESLFETANNQRLNFTERGVFTTLNFQLDNIQQQLETESDPNVIEALNKKSDFVKKQIQDFLITKKTDLMILTLADGSQSFYTPEMVEELSNDRQFLLDFASQNVSLSFLQPQPTSNQKSVADSLTNKLEALMSDERYKAELEKVKASIGEQAAEATAEISEGISTNTSDMFLEGLSSGPIADVETMVSKNETIDGNYMSQVLDNLYNKLDLIEQLNLNDQQKGDLISLTEGLIQKFESYDNIAKGTTVTVTERKASTRPVTDARKVKDQASAIENAGGKKGVLLRPAKRGGGKVSQRVASIDTTTIPIESEVFIVRDNNDDIVGYGFKLPDGNELFVEDPGGGIDLALTQKIEELGAAPQLVEQVFEDVMREVEVAPPTTAKPKTKEDAVQKQTAGQVPVQPGAEVSEAMAQGESKAESQVAAEAGQEGQGEAKPEEEIVLENTPESVSNFIANMMNQREFVYTLDNIDKGIETAKKQGNKKLEKMLKDAKGVMKALGTTNPSITIHYNQGTYTKAWIDAGGKPQDSLNQGFYISKDGSQIHINLPLATSSNLVFHEGAHPVLDWLAENNPEVIDRLFDELSGLKEFLIGVDDVIKFGTDNYTGTQAKKEAIVEFMSRVADGQIKLPPQNTTLFKKIADFINNLLNRIGIDFGVTITDKDSITDVARKFTDSVKQGKKLDVKAADMMGPQAMAKIKESGYGPYDTIFNKPELKNNTNYGWRSMGEGEFNELIVGNKTYEGGSPRQGNWISGNPESASEHSGAGKILVEFGNIDIVGGESMSKGSKADKTNVTKVWKYNNSSKKFEDAPELLEKLRNSEKIEESYQSKLGKTMSDLNNAVNDFYDYELPALKKAFPSDDVFLSYDDYVEYSKYEDVYSLLNPKQKDIIDKINSREEQISNIEDLISKLDEKEITLDNAIKEYNKIKQEKPSDMAVGPQAMAATINQEMQDIVSKAKADGTFMKAPNGQPTKLNEQQWTQVRTNAFKNWFGDWENDPQNASKIVDENGEPQVMFTGTSKDKDFDKFNVPKNGTWFTTDSEEASRYAMENDSMNVKYNPITNKYQDINTASRVIPVFLNIKRPEFFNDAVTKEQREKLRYADNYKKLQGQYFQDIYYRKPLGDRTDGLYYSDNKQIVVVLESPNQIKSATGNIGTFSPESPKIQAMAATGGQNEIEQIQQIIQSIKDFNPDISDQNINDGLLQQGFTQEQINEAKGLPLPQLPNIPIGSLFPDTTAGLLSNTRAVFERIAEKYASEGFLEDAARIRTIGQYEKRTREILEADVKDLLEHFGGAEQAYEFVMNNPINSDIKTMIIAEAVKERLATEKTNPSVDSRVALEDALYDLAIHGTDLGQGVNAYQYIYEQIPELFLQSKIQATISHITDVLGNPDIVGTQSNQIVQVANKARAFRNTFFDDIADFYAGTKTYEQLVGDDSKFDNKVKNAIKVLLNYGQNFDKEALSQLLKGVKEKGIFGMAETREDVKPILVAQINDLNGKLKIPLSEAQVNEFAESLLDFYEGLAFQRLNKEMQLIFQQNPSKSTNKENLKLIKAISYGALNNANAMMKLAQRFNLPTQLTPQQQQTLLTAAQGYTNAQGALAKQQALFRFNQQAAYIQYQNSKGFQRFLKKLKHLTALFESYFYNGILFSLNTFDRAIAGNIQRTSGRLLFSAIRGDMEIIKQSSATAFMPQDYMNEFTYVDSSGVQQTLILENRMNEVFDNVYSSLRGLPRLSEVKRSGLNSVELMIRESNSKGERMAMRTFLVPAGRLMSAFDALTTPLNQTITKRQVYYEFLKELQKTTPSLKSLNKIQLVDLVNQIVEPTGNSVSAAMTQAREDVINGQLYAQLGFTKPDEFPIFDPRVVSLLKPGETISSLTSKNAKIYNEWLYRVREILDTQESVRLQDIASRNGWMTNMPFDAVQVSKNVDYYVSRIASEMVFLATPRGSMGAIATSINNFINTNAVTKGSKYVGLMPLFVNAAFNGIGMMIRVLPIVNAAQLAKYLLTGSRGKYWKTSEREFEIPAAVKLDKQQMIATVATTNIIAAGLYAALEGLYKDDEEEKEAAATFKWTGITNIRITKAQEELGYRPATIYINGVEWFDYKDFAFGPILSAVAFCKNYKIWNFGYRDNKPFYDKEGEYVTLESLKEGENESFKEIIGNYLLFVLTTAGEQSTIRDMTKSVNDLIDVLQPKTTEQDEKRHEGVLQKYGTKKLGGFLKNLIPYQRAQAEIKAIYDSFTGENKKLATDLYTTIALGTMAEDVFIKTDGLDYWGRPVKDKFTLVLPVAGSVTIGEPYPQDRYRSLYLKNNYNPVLNTNEALPIHISRSELMGGADELEKLQNEVKQDMLATGKDKLSFRPLDADLFDPAKDKQIYDYQLDKETVTMINQMTVKFAGKFVDMNIDRLESMDKKTFTKAMDSLYRIGRQVAIYQNLYQSGEIPYEADKQDMYNYVSDMIEGFKKSYTQKEKANLIWPDEFDATLLLGLDANSKIKPENKLKN
jgi:hypothetical protein